MITTDGYAQTRIRVLDQMETPLAGATIYGFPQGWLQTTDESGQASLPAADSVYVEYLGLRGQHLSWLDLMAADSRVILKSLSAVELPKIVVRDRLGRDLSQARVSITPLAIQAAQVSTSAAALATEAGAYVQKSQQGGGSPVLRGFEANRILLIVDNVRMNNAIYRNGHLQNAITIDENSLADLSVSYGPGALAYGSDALGGVVHFQTKTAQPLPSLAKEKVVVTGKFGGRYATAAKEKMLFGNLNWQGRRWASTTFATATRFDDLRAGRRHPSGFENFGRRTIYITTSAGEDQFVDNPNPERQVGSGYDQLDILQKVVYNLNEAWQFQLNLQLSTSTDVPRYDRLTEIRNGQLRFAEWRYGPQRRHLYALESNWRGETLLAERLRVIFSHQDIQEDRYERRVFDPWRENNVVNVKVQSLTIDVNRPLPVGELVYGTDIRFNQVAASSFRGNIQTGEQIFDVNSRYPSAGSELWQAGAYAQYRYQNADSTLLLEAGGRFTGQQLLAQFGASDPMAWPENYLAGITNKSTSANWGVGLKWQSDPWQFRTHLATGFRAPNIDDFAKFRERNGFVQIPNPDLQPERTLTADVAITRQLGDHTRLEATLFRTWLTDAMVRQDFLLPDGSPFFVNRGDTLFVQSNVNVESGRLWGVFLGAKTHLTSSLSLEGQVHYTYGRRDFALGSSDVLEVPLDHIPPLYGHLRMKYRRAKWEGGLQWQFQAAKQLENYAVSSVAEVGGQFVLNRTGTSDNLEQSPWVNGVNVGTYGWSVFHLRASYLFHTRWRLRLNFNNIFDLHYRTFASGISAPGRDLAVGLYGWF